MHVMSSTEMHSTIYPFLLRTKIYNPDNFHSSTAGTT